MQITSTIPFIECYVVFYFVTYWTVMDCHENFNYYIKELYI